MSLVTKVFQKLTPKLAALATAAGATGLLSGCANISFDTKYGGISIGGGQIGAVARGGGTEVGGTVNTENGQMCGNVDSWGTRVRGKACTEAGSTPNTRTSEPIPGRPPGAPTFQ